MQGLWLTHTNMGHQSECTLLCSRSVCPLRPPLLTTTSCVCVCVCMRGARAVRPASVPSPSRPHAFPCHCRCVVLFVLLHLVSRFGLIYSIFVFCSRCPSLSLSRSLARFFFYSLSCSLSLFLSLSRCVRVRVCARCHSPRSIPCPRRLRLQLTISRDREHICVPFPVPSEVSVACDLQCALRGAGLGAAVAVRPEGTVSGKAAPLWAWSQPRPFHCRMDGHGMRQVSEWRGRLGSGPVGLPSSLRTLTIPPCRRKSSRCGVVWAWGDGG